MIVKDAEKSAIITAVIDFDAKRSGAIHKRLEMPIFNVGFTELDLTVTLTQLLLIAEFLFLSAIEELLPIRDYIL